MKFYRISTGYFVCGLHVDKDVVVDAAPIMGWAVGKAWEQVQAWIATKRGEIEEL